METKTALTVRYAETDKMGIVHHSNYAIWFEIGRTDLIKRFGITYSAIEEMGIMLPLYELNCKYIAPAKYEDKIIVTTSIKEISRARISFSYKVCDSVTDKLLATGVTLHAWTDKNLKPINAEKIFPEIYSKLSSN